MKGYVRASRSTIELPRALDDAAGREVVCRDGRALGRVVDVVFDENHVERAYLEVESDGALGIRHKHFLAPVGAVDLASNPIVASISSRELAQSPGHDRSMPFSEEYEMALLGFWGTQFTQDVEAVRDPLVERPGETHSMRPEQFDSDPSSPHSRYRTRDSE